MAYSRFVVTKRPPKLHVPTHFKNGVSSTSKRDLLNDKLVANVPKRPGEDPNAQPSNMAVARRRGVEFRK